MMLRRVVPSTDETLDSEHPDARQTLLEWYQPHSPEYLRLNLVTTLDGRAAGPDGTSESLTSRTDRLILGVIRDLADGVLVGAETVRREGLRRPRRAALAIVTATGDLTGHAIVDDGDHTAPVLVLTTALGAARAAETLPLAHVVIVPTDAVGRIAPAEIVATLRQHGLRRIVAEGGPTLAAQLFSAHLVDEVCLTVMPRLGGSALPVLGSAASAVSPLTAVQLLVDDAGAQYGRWAVRHEKG